MRYLPILRWKRGERVAVQRLSVNGRRDVLPVFVVGTDQYVGRNQTATRPAIPPPAVLAQELESIWGNAPFYLDAMALPPGAAGHHPLVEIAASARATGLNLIPATRLDASPQYANAVNAVAAADRRGVLLVVDLQQFTSVATWAAGWPIPLNATDLLLNLADNVGTVSALGAALDPAFQGLHEGVSWRSVTMSGTSMPENFAGYIAGTHTIPRTEMALWTRLSEIRLPYRLDYGDYATVALVPPPSGIRWGYPINVRYTLSDAFVICRGVATTGPGAVDMDVQLLSHARTINTYPTRGRLAHCWGDGTIDAIAAGTETPQALEHWVRISVNRHIELTRSLLP